jgi:hypothetical protein
MSSSNSNNTNNTNGQAAASSSPTSPAVPGQLGYGYGHLTRAGYPNGTPTFSPTSADRLRATSSAPRPPEVVALAGRINTLAGRVARTEVFDSSAVDEVEATFMQLLEDIRARPVGAGQMVTEGLIDELEDLRSALQNARGRAPEAGIPELLLTPVQAPGQVNVTSGAAAGAAAVREDNAPAPPTVLTPEVLQLVQQIQHITVFVTSMSDIDQETARDIGANIHAVVRNVMQLYSRTAGLVHDLEALQAALETRRAEGVRLPRLTFIEGDADRPAIGAADASGNDEADDAAARRNAARLYMGHAPNSNAADIESDNMNAPNTRGSSRRDAVGGDRQVILPDEINPDNLPAPENLDPVNVIFDGRTPDQMRRLVAQLGPGALHAFVQDYGDDELEILVNSGVLNSDLTHGRGVRPSRSQYESEDAARRREERQEDLEEINEMILGEGQWVQLTPEARAEARAAGGPVGPNGMVFMRNTSRER